MKRWLVGGLIAALGGGAAAAQTGSLDFDRIFGAGAKPARLHAHVTYEIGGKAHALEIWRDGEQRVRRRTDDAIETFVVRAGAGPDWRMTVLDLKRHTRTDVDRGSLNRIGQFSDWFSFSHALARPAGAYRLVAAKAPAGIDAPAAACRWYGLTQGGAATSICWSARLQLPIVIADAKGVVQWRVTSVEPGAVPDEAFAVHDAGFVRVDAAADIQGD